MRDRLLSLGGRLGILYCIAGFVLVFLGWNGAATYNRTFEQFPYLVSGGIAGLGLIVLGSALIIAQSLREDRSSLRGSIDELRAAIEGLGGGAVGGGGTAAGAGAGAGGGGDTVVASTASYHRVTCRVVEGQAGMVPMSLAEAAASGRTACRICAPDDAAPLRSA